MSGGWVGFDLDGTLAHTVGTEIGPPIEAMIQVLREHLGAGIECRVFTARAEWPSQCTLVQDWLEAQGLPRLRVTNVKDQHCFQLWDDRAVSVERNTGRCNTVNVEWHRQLCRG